MIPSLPSHGRLALVHEAHASELAAAFLRAHLQPMADTTMRGERDQGLYRGYRIDDGAAIVPLRGSLITDGPFVGSAWGVTSYEGFRAEMRRAAADPKAAGIIVAINSNGGMVAGLETASQAIVDAKAKKPVVAMVEGFAASAAYWLASQADEIVLSPLSEVGSIGVVGMHVDYSGAFEKAGFKVTLIASGAHKTDANPFGPLDAATLADWQADVDRLRGEFAAAVGRGRGARFNADQALATEARMFPASDAVKMGLADRVGSIDDVVARYSGAAKGRPHNAQRRTAMSESSNGPVFAQADLDKARAEGHAAAVAEQTAARQAAVAEAVQGERARIAAIVGGEEAKGREELAHYFAFETDMSAETVAAALKKAPAAAGAQSIASRAEGTALRRVPEGNSAGIQSESALKQAGAMPVQSIVDKINAEVGAVAPARR